jgi:hypothetical protein
VFLSDFGVSATVGGVALRGIFDNGYADAFGIVSGSAPVLLISSSSAPSVVVGDAVVIGSSNYSVASIEPDGLGMTRLVLK